MNDKSDENEREGILPDNNLNIDGAVNYISSFNKLVDEFDRITEQEIKPSPIDGFIMSSLLAASLFFIGWACFDFGWDTIRIIVGWLFFTFFVTYGSKFSPRSK